MCIAVPSKVIEINDLTAIIDVQGARRQVNLMLLAEPAAIGDYVLVHAGFAIHRLDPEAGAETLALFEDLCTKLPSL